MDKFLKFFGGGKKEEKLVTQPIQFNPENKKINEVNNQVVQQNESKSINVQSNQTLNNTSNNLNNSQNTNINNQSGGQVSNNQSQLFLISSLPNIIESQFPQGNK